MCCYSLSYPERKHNLALEGGHQRPAQAILDSPGSPRACSEDFVPGQLNSRKSLRRAEDAIANLNAFFGLSRALDITTDRIKTFACSRQDAGVKAATIQYELSVLRRMFTLAIKDEKLNYKPYVPRIEVRNIRARFFMESEFRAVLSFLPEEVQPVIEFCHLTGWRIGEVLPLRCSQVDWGAKTIRLEPDSTKNDEGRVFPFGKFPELEALLFRQRERTKALERATSQIVLSVFHRNGRPIKNFRKSWVNACQAAGLPGAWVHDLRRCGVRALERAGVPRSWAMKLTGHKTESIYRRYAIVSEADLAEGVSRLAALYQGHSDL